MKAKSANGRLLAAVALVAVAATAGLDSFGATISVRNKAEFLGAVAEASDGQGRLNQDLSVTFAADCAPMVVGEADIWNESAKCILDCAGHRICLDAGQCPSGTVVVGALKGERKNGRPVAIKGCGKGSVFRNLTVINHGRLEFDSVEDTLAKDCDFKNCGIFADTGAEAGGAIKGCGTVEGCGFERCQARTGGALSGCGYVSECVFLDCRATDGGGAIAGATDVFRCEFRGCSSDVSNDDGFGGAIYGGRDIVSCLFVDCSARQGGAIMPDGNVGSPHAKVVHCTFIRCRGEFGGEAVYEDEGDVPVFMLNCLGHGCDLWQDGADAGDKFNCHKLVGTDFFLDYENGDFHPNPSLAEDWADPCGLHFGDCGAAIFACRDLDGYGYQFSSPWPDCPGCYRFREEAERERNDSDESAGLSKYTVIKHRKSASPGHWRSPSKPDRAPVSDFGNSVRNRPPKVVSRRTGPALIDLSELPCTITQNEILHEGDDLLSFVSSWYERTADLARFYDLRGPLKMPEVGVDPGYGCPGEILPYEEDEELKELARRYGFRTGWFRFGCPKKGDRNYLRWSRIEDAERKVNERMCGFTNDLERIPFLLSPAVGEGKFPLVVYIAGSGEQGTDLKKMFRQTGVFDAVCEPSFAEGHPCHILAIIVAFCGNECRGGKFATYFPPTQRYIYQLPVYGEGGDDITFKLYNHDLQEELDLTCTVELQWNKDGYGRLATPYNITFVSSVSIAASVNPANTGTITGAGTYMPGETATLTATANAGYVFANWTEGGNVVSQNATYSFTVTTARDLVANFNAAQSYTLNSGWNWFSTYIEQNGIDGLSMLEEGLGEHGEFIQSRTGAMVENFDGSFWWGDLNAVTNEDMYEVKTNAQVSVTMTGSVANPASHPITVAPGWNWIGYVSDATKSVDNALSSLTPNEDDVIQGRNAFSSYFPGWGWYGDLENMTPGQGYMYKSNGTASQTLVYPTTIRSTNTDIVDYHYNANYNKYRDVMDVMAKVIVNGDLPTSDRYELAAFVNGECRGRAKLQYVEPMQTYLAFITINGNDDEIVTFSLYDENLNVTYYASEANIVVFKANEVVGKFRNPYILSFNNAENVENTIFTVYPNPVVQGDEMTVNFMEEIAEAEMFVENELGLTVDAVKLSGKSAKVRFDWPSGVYVLRVVVDGNVYYNKVIVK